MGGISKLPERNFFAEQIQTNAEKLSGQIHLPEGANTQELKIQTVAQNIFQVAYAPDENQDPNNHLFSKVRIRALQEKVNLLLQDVDKEIQKKEKTNPVILKLNKIKKDIIFVQQKTLEQSPHLDALYTIIEKLAGEQSAICKIIPNWESASRLSEQEILDLSLDYTQPHTDSKQQNRAFLQSAVAAFSSEVIASPMENLEIQQFASHTTGLTPSKLFIQRPQQGVATGASGNPLFLVFNKSTNELCCVIKGNFEGAEMTREINALRLMNSLDTGSCRFPKVLGIATVTQAGQKLFLCAQTAAPGKPLNLYMDELSVAQGEDRVKVYDDLKTIIGIAAQSMADLHKTSQIGTSDRKEAIQKREAYIQQLKKNMLLDIFKLETLGTTTLDIDFGSLKSLESTSFTSRGCYVHGDFHLGNAFYEPTTDVFTLIDNDELLKSVVDEIPVGVAAYDFVYFSKWISVLGMMKNLHLDEIKDLQNAFKQKYENAFEKGALPVNDEELRFMDVFASVRYIAALFAALEDREAPWRETLGVETIGILIKKLVNDLPARVL